MVIMVPTERKLSLQSYQDLLPKKEDGVTPSFAMPDWLEPLQKVSQFLHFFRDEMCLPDDIMKEIFTALMQSHLDGAMDNIIVIRKIPKSDSQQYTKKWIIEQLFDLLAKHQAVVLDPKQDV